MLTPRPPITLRPLPEKYGAGMSWLARMPATGSFVHTMVGWLWSTDTYFRLASTLAATDYGIGGAGDGDSDGEIFQWIDYAANPFEAGWASGWDNAPDYDGDGAAYVQAFGIRGINGGGRSVECSGLVNTPMTAKQWGALCHMLAYIHHAELNQSADHFAWNMHHREVAEKDCPFPRIYNHTIEYQTVVTTIMREFERESGNLPKTMTIAGLDVPLPDDDKAGPVTNPVPPIFVQFAKPIVVHTRPGALSRQWGYTGSKIVRRYDAGTRLRIRGYYHGETVKGSDRWFVIVSPGASNNARIHESGIKEPVPDPAVDIVTR